MSAIKKLSASNHGTEGRKTARTQRFGHPEIDPPASQSLAMRRLLSQASDAAQTADPLFIFGEVGVGKRWLAGEINRLAGVESVTLDCRRLREIYEGEGIESALVELNRFGESDAGALIVHRVEELALPLQRPVFKILLSRESRRIILTSVVSQKDLRRGSRWMPGFFEAFEWLCLDVPPLRSRMEDLFGLAKYFAMLEGGRQIAESALDALAHRKFLGNVQELKDMIRSASQYLADGEAISQLGDESSWADVFVINKPFQSFSFNEHVEAFEKHVILLGLRRCEGNQSATARLLDMPRQTLIMKMKRYELL